MGIFLSKKIDPVSVLHETVMENVFTYLPKQDLMRCSLVSQSWYKFIGNSQICMRNFELKLCNFHNFSQEDMELLMNSERKYQNVSIYDIHLSRRVKLVLEKFKWQHVMMYKHTFLSDQEFIEFFRPFEQIIKRIQLREIHILHISKDFHSLLLFPKLRHLEIDSCSRFIANKVFNKTSELDCLKLHFRNTRMYDDEMRTVAMTIGGYLNRNSKLKHLNLGIPSEIFGLLFSEDITSFVRFKLTKLKLFGFTRNRHSYNSIAMKNLEIFIRLHRQTLVDIHFDKWLGLNFLRLVFNAMPNLVNVTIKELHMYEIREGVDLLALNANPSIENLNIHNFSQYHRIFEIVLKATPNIKCLKMYSMSQEILELLASYTTQLEILLTSCVTATKPVKGKNAFSKLKYFSTQLFISREYMEAMNVMPVEKQTNFDRHFLQYNHRGNKFRMC